MHVFSFDLFRLNSICLFDSLVHDASVRSTGTENSTQCKDSLVPLMDHDPRDLGLICFFFVYLYGRHW